MYELEKPQYFQLLLLIPVLWGLFAYTLYYRRKKQKAFASKAMMMILAPYRSTSAMVWKYIIYTFVIIFATLALVNPRIGTSTKTIKQQGSDIVFALDVSLSMKSEDITPSRLDKAKQIISRTIDELGGDRIGMIIFAGNAYPLLPITSDYSAAKMFLSTAEPDMVSSQGTSISQAIALSGRYFDDPSIKNKLLVIISDGEDLDEDFDVRTMAQGAMDKGVKIYTIGVGTPNGGPIPIRQNGQVIDYKKDSQGNVVVTKLDSAILSRIASIADGKYIDGTSTNAVVEQIKELLGKGEKNEYDDTQIVEYKDRYQWFAGAALGLLVLATMLSSRRSKFLSRYNLFNEEKPTEED